MSATRSLPIKKTEIQKHISVTQKKIGQKTAKYVHNQELSDFSNNFTLR